jgi:hypothetical protein
VILLDEYIDSFTQGPVISKLWLCTELEKILDTLNYTNPTVHIFGGWVNVLGFMLQIRKPEYYNEINSYDMDDESTRISNNLCDAFKFTKSKIYNITADASKLDFRKLPELIFVNCSIDQFEDTTWYNNIPNGSIVCLQTTTLPIKNAPWRIVQETRNMNELLEKYKLSKVLYQGTKQFPIFNSSFTRLMAIGIK